MTVDPRRARIARNEAAFRDINERLQAQLRRVPHVPDLLEFVCECGNRDCDAVVRLTIDEYETVRSDPRRFAVMTGHSMPDAERTIAANDRFEVVEKIGEAARIAEQEDPRG